jgi:hypothetical protein
MKNVHLLASPKPSRLFYHSELKQLVLTNKIILRDVVLNQNIYITSDVEIKEGDWCLDIKRNIIFQSKRNEIGTSKKIPIIICTYEGCYIKKDCKKIILTTDQDLIKDGVQAIDDEFLEWFVKNPSCEEVEVKCYSKFNDGDFIDYKIFEEKLKHINKIIIPKQHPQFGTKEFNDLANQYFGGKPSTKLHKGEVVDESYPKEFKQETLEEVAINYSNNFTEDEGKFAIEDFINGAKWQQEQDAEEIKLLREEISYLKRNKNE